ncbi:MAG: hypothetical protein ACYTFM_06070 [Planctomycetota bacterium]|jgi:hypothetical protein
MKTKRKLVIGMTLSALVLVGCESKKPDAPAFVNAYSPETIYETCRQNYSMSDKIELTLIMDVNTNVPIFDSNEYDNVRTASTLYYISDGNRSMRDHHIYEGKAKKKSKVIKRVWDGIQSTVFYQMKNEAFITPDNTVMSPAMSGYYGQVLSLFYAIKSNELDNQTFLEYCLLNREGLFDIENLGIETVNGIDCVHIKSTRKNEDFVGDGLLAADLWFAVNKRMVPVKLNLSRALIVKGKRFVTDSQGYTVFEIGESKGFYYPKRYESDRNDYVKSYMIENLTLNPQVDDSTFSIEIPAGTKVSDSRGDERYRIVR